MTDTKIESRPDDSPDDSANAAEGPLLEVRDLKKHFPIKGGLFRRTVGAVKAVDGVNLTVNRGETLAVVGESGCGKSTTGRTILRLEEPTDGEVVFHHPKLGPVNLATADSNTMQQIRPRMQIIFQDPFASLDSRMTVGRVIAEPLIINKVMKGQQLRDRVADLLTMVGLRPEHASRYPHAFSGGQRQRIGIARAIALDPDLIICDEAVSALDVSVQAQVINLLEDLQDRLKLTYVFISHDLSVVEHISDRVAVMYVGKLVETGPTQELFSKPKHPYTEALLSAVPQPDPRTRTEVVPLTGDVPSPANPPSGCYFHTRCPYAQDICSVETPLLRDVGEGRQAACHFSDQLNLKGAVVPSAEALPDAQPDVVTEVKSTTPSA
ncbi:dipeptide ABC transporter ATP-binding protein [Microlunatus elymi]|uniref:Dipeptide ABC transporter ATP-binding protein n=1 Tax=Microlunatus elymi TaxID=2596828 RepID=A0A516PZU2_9ACTN|nr:dipeptide ABC transporter ATP-binding protein [Microlunatus elymi]QDP96690.1 dipeptide ABC transporter ATP-binding protein [Microlunatus elymi]